MHRFLLAALGALFAACGTRDGEDAEVAARLGISPSDVRLAQKAGHVSKSDLLAMPRGALTQMLERLHGVANDQPDAATAWRLLTLRDENGRIPHNALLRAKAQVAGPYPQGTAGGLTSTAWTELGPGNIGGRVRALHLHPSSLNMFIGSVSGGIWKSTNQGSTWLKVDDLMSNLAITSIVAHPYNSSVVFAATGEGFGNADAIRGAGIFKSTDTGVTWTQLASTNNPSFYWVNRLAMAPDNSAMLAATSTGMYRSTDAGASWTRVYGTANTNCLDVKWHGYDKNIVVGSVLDRDTGLMADYNATIYSTNAGVSWTLSPSLQSYNRYERIELAFARDYNAGATPGCLYALKANGATGGGLRVFRSLNGGSTFQGPLWTSPVNPPVANPGWYALALWVDPTDTNMNTGDDLIVVGSLDLWRSVDGGASFTPISDWTKWPISAHADQHVIKEHWFYSGTGNPIVYVGNDGGMWRTDNIRTVTPTAGWVSLNSNLPITQLYGASRHPASDIVIGGTQDNGTLRYTGNPNGWSIPAMIGGDGGFCASDPTGAGLYHYGEYTYLRLYRSVDGGQTATPIHAGTAPNMGITDAGDFNPPRANFIAPFVLDPNDANTMLAGGNNLWRSTDVKTGANWATIPGLVTGTQISPISAIAVYKQNSNYIWVGYNDGQIWYTANAKAAFPTWTRRHNTTPALPARYVTRIKIDPAINSHVFVTFGGFNGDNVWQTVNEGANRTPATGLPQAPVRDLEIHETKSNWLYAATEVGLLVSENNGASWTATATPATVSIDQLFWSSHSLYLVTHGRGVFRQLAYPNATASSVGSPCQYGGPVAGPTLTSGLPVLGSTLAFNLSGGISPGTAALYLSNVPTAPIQLSPGCFVQIDLSVLVNLGSVALTATGTATWSLPLPDVPAFAGISLMSQAAVVSAGVLRLSNGRKLALGY